jgi:hypothetical protein
VTTVFITGMQRSGTTLLEKLLAQQPDISMLSQPFPLLFLSTKRRFLRDLGGEPDAFPLGHLFGENRYTPNDLAAFLSRWRTSRAELAALFAEMANYSGQYSRFDAARLDAAFASISDDDDFVTVVATLLRQLAVRPEARWFGSKEANCEELVPHFLERDFRCAIVIRDPRDIVASLNYGDGRTYGGEIKPTLFNVRSWRKSVSFALQCDGMPRFHRCRYEELVADPVKAMRALAANLDIAITSTDFRELRDATGEAWHGNSSHRAHDGVSASSVGTFRTVLPPEVSTFIEAACLPELQLLGYETSLTAAGAVRALHEFREPWTITRKGLDGDMATPGNARIEEARLLERLRP